MGYFGSGKEEYVHHKVQLPVSGKYYGFTVKQNREEGEKYFSDSMKEPINNFFDEHNDVVSGVQEKIISIL